MKITRTYEHRTFGRIGEAVLEMKDGGLVLDGVPLEPEAAEHLLTFALQTLQDAYAGAKSADEARALWEKKRDRILSNSIGTRGPGSGRGELDQMAIKIARPLVVAKLKAAEKYADDYQPLSPKERDDFVAGVLDKNPGWAETIREQAKKAIAAAKAKPADDLEIDF